MTWSVNCRGGRAARSLVVLALCGACLLASAAAAGDIGADSARADDALLAKLRSEREQVEGGGGGGMRFREVQTSVETDSDAALRREAQEAKREAAEARGKEQKERVHEAEAERQLDEARAEAARWRSMAQAAVDRARKSEVAAAASRAEHEKQELDREAAEQRQLHEQLVAWTEQMRTANAAAIASARNQTEQAVEKLRSVEAREVDEERRASQFAEEAKRALETAKGQSAARREERERAAAQLQRLRSEQKEWQQAAARAVEMGLNATDMVPGDADTALSSGGVAAAASRVRFAEVRAGSTVSAAATHPRTAADFLSTMRSVMRKAAAARERAGAAKAAREAASRRARADPAGARVERDTASLHSAADDVERALSMVEEGEVPSEAAVGSALARNAALPDVPSVEVGGGARAVFADVDELLGLPHVSTDVGEHSRAERRREARIRKGVMNALGGDASSDSVRAAELELLQEPVPSAGGGQRSAVGEERSEGGDAAAAADALLSGSGVDQMQGGGGGAAEAAAAASAPDEELSAAVEDQWARIEAEQAFEKVDHDMRKRLKARV